MRAFANGGSSLTGIEAVSNAVSALRPPAGRNARQVLVIQGSIVASLIAGISWLAHVSHAVPYTSGYPTVLAQEASLIFGPGALGRVLFYVVQAGTAAILFTGGNTSFSGFPFLASFVAEDSFLPRWLTKRGHRLVFSNGIIVLTVVSLTLLIVVGANVNRLIPFYAIGVFTGFTMAGFGMARYHRRNRGPGWRRHLAISLDRRNLYRPGRLDLRRGQVHRGRLARRRGLPDPGVRVHPAQPAVPDGSDCAGEHRRPRKGRRSRLPTPAATFTSSSTTSTWPPSPALRYARSLRPTSLRAVHFVIDNVQADKLRQDWLRANPGIPLDFVDSPDRRLAAAAANLVSADAALPGVGVTAILPRRSYTPIVGRLLHDRTADKMAAMISRIPHAVATIVPFDVRSRVESLTSRGPAARMADAAGTPPPATAEHRSRQRRQQP